MVGASDTRRSGRVSFGPFRLNAVERVLERNGRPVRLGGRALDILIVLLERPGDVVAHRDLIARVWPNIHVNDGALRAQVWGLRQALADGVDGARYVVNVPGRGYCFVGAVEDDRARTPADGAVPPGPAPSPLLTNLRRRLGPLIGREAELAALSARIGEKPLMTIVGGGGIGKSSLANEVGWRTAERFPQGTWLVDLAPLAEGTVVPAAVAAVLGVSLQDGDTAVDAIAAAIGRRRMLLILDNCERLTAPSAELVEKLLQQAPALAILAASQEPLRLDREQVFRLAPLAVPPAGTVDVSEYPAVALFVERAREADRQFELTAGNAPGIAEICRRLDGNPLALEMAAARLLLLGIEALRKGLDERLRILKTHRRTEAGRHQTLRSMVEWSYGLLDAETGPFFRRPAVFPASFALDAAVAVGGEGNAEHWDVVDRLGTLISKSLVVAETSEPPRFRLLETLRLFGLEQLAAEREAASIFERHARYFSDLFDRAHQLRETMPEDAWSRLYLPEVDNVRAALDWALTPPERPDIAVSLAAAAGALWETLGMSHEGRRYLDKVASLIDPQASDAAAARFWGQSGYLLRKHDGARAFELLERSTAIYRRLGDRLNLARYECNRGNALAKRGLLAEAKTVLSDAHAVLSGSDFMRSELMALVNLGVLASYSADGAETRRYFAEALELAEARGFFSIATTCKNNIAVLEYIDGNFDLAAQIMQELVDRLRADRDHESLELYLGNLFHYLMLAGRVAEARPVAEETLPRLRFLGGDSLLHCLKLWAMLLTLEGQHRLAARLMGFVVQGYPRLGIPRHPPELETHRRLMDILEAALPAAEIEALMAQGAGWSEGRAIDFVMNCPAPPRP